MPELPEVETVRRGLEPAMAGQTIVTVDQRRADLRWPFPDHFVDRLTGVTIQGLRRRAKYLLADLSSEETLIMHLGMSGSFRIEPIAPDGQTRVIPEETTASGAPKPVADDAFHFARSKISAHDHVVLTLKNNVSIVYNDPRRFGFMLLAATQTIDAHKLFRDMGVEPMGNELNADYLASRCAGRKMPLKAALLDQKIIAGLGNIYVCEALWRAQLSPTSLAGRLARKDGTASTRAERLVTAIRQVISEAIAAGGSSLRDHVQTDGSMGYFQKAHAVYDREHEPCLRPGCSGTVQRIVQSNRSTFYCSQCQR